MIIVYTDGSCRGNGSEGAKGGWAYVVIDENDEIVSSGSGGELNTTNNRMEMSALLAACEIFNERAKYEPIEIYMDSAYCHNCFVQKWYKTWQKNGWINSKREPVKNRDLWEQIIPYFDNPNFHFRKVKGHSNSKWNNVVDKMAVAAAMALED